MMYKENWDGTIRQELEKYPALTLSVVRKVIIDIRDFNISI